jgi:ubiquinone/menaquinone biosynthesis C-methylase UbiE
MMLPELPKNPSILDVGCGPGMQTIQLAKLTRGEVYALDFHQPFLEHLMKKAKKRSCCPKNQTRQRQDFGT